eukprot:gb/GEZN01023081.1/.p1 GENE.gb/GEZN01023081.1/~~gb/GEZN01023081.1/.p1  ORF type:complete len:113 (+),score=14.30 gb/GEZN01023081.1/:167-505(+)
MSGLMNLCECIAIQIRRHLETVEGILTRANGQEVISASGQAPVSLAVPSGSMSEGLSIPHLLAMMFVTLFVAALFSRTSRPAPNLVEKPARHDREDRGGGGGNGGDPPDLLD